VDDSLVKMRFMTNAWQATGAVTVFFLTGLATCRISATEGAEPLIASGVVADAEKQEVRFPARFVNPSRNLEVFACHENGPTHETVLSFEAEGKEIHRALREVGFRGVEFWNATSPEDLKLTGGDRALVWLRWEWKGRSQEYLAEEVLAEEGTGLPFFCRGFTFSAHGRKDAPSSSSIPRAVELTIGGTSRQSASYSMLYHPNDLAVLVNWTPPAEVGAKRIPDLPALVESNPPCTLIIRRLRTEREFIDLLLDRETDSKRRTVRENQRPLASAIDERKGRFESLVHELQRAIAEGETKKSLSTEESRSIATRIQGLTERGRALAEEIRGLYLDLWDLEERHRLVEAGDLKSLDDFQRGWHSEAYRSGFQFERLLSARRREAAQLFESGDLDPVRREDLRRAIEAEMESLEAERERRWARFKLQMDVRPRLKALDPREDEYIASLFREEEARILADMRALRARTELANLQAVERRARSAGRWPQEEKTVLQTRALSEMRQTLAAAERTRVDHLEQIRWAKNPLGNPDPVGEKAKDDEVRRLQGAMIETEKRIQDLRGGLEKATGRPAGSGEEPPEGPDGQVLHAEESS